MKVQSRKLAARLPWLRSLIITASGLCCVFGLGLIDYHTPGPMSFVLFYMVVVVLVGRHAGKWPAMFISGIAVIMLATVQWGLGRGAPQTVWVALWNNSTRFVVFSIAGWLTAELTRLTRHLSDLVAERTAQWKSEAEQHKATSIRLAEALDRFEQVINNITEVFWLTDVSKNHMAYVSPAYERIWGRTCEDLYREPRSWVAAVHPMDRDEILRCAQTDQATGSYDVEYRIIRPDGDVRWIRDRAYPVRNKQGEVYRVAGIAQDITERKRTRELLQTQAAILEHMAEGVVVTDEQGMIVQMNPAGEQIWGYGRNEVLGQPASVFSALPEPEATAVMQEVLAALQATGSWRGTFENRRKDGTIILCEAVISRLELPGRVLMVAVEQDVTERLRAQEQLQMQARVLESMAEAAVMVDENGSIVLTNPALDALMGYEAGELSGKPLQILTTLTPEAYNARVGAAVEALRTRDVAVGEYVARRKDGTLIQVEARGSGVSVGGHFWLVVVGQDITERKRAEQALRQSEETLRVFVDALPEPAMLLDREGTILLANRALPQSLGIPEGKLLGQYVFGLIPARVAETRKAMFDQVLRTRKPVHYEDARGDRHFMNFESPVLDPAGNVTRVALFALDITQRKRAETMVRESEQTYRSLVETTGTGYLILDMQGRVLDANAEYIRLSGHKTLKDILGRSVMEWTAPEDRDTHAAAVESCLKTGAVKNLELNYAGPDGLTTAIEINGTVVQMAKGPAILSLCRDITLRKRTESALVRQEALYRTLFELSPDGILLEDVNGNILDANEALCHSFGYSREEMLRQNVRCFVPPENWDGVEAHLATLRAGETLEHEVWNLQKNGERCLMRLNEKLLPLPDGRQGVLVVARDITEGKRRELIKEVFLSLGAKLSAVRTPVEAARTIHASADQLWTWDSSTLDLYSQESDLMEPVLFCDVVDGLRGEVPAVRPAGSPTARMRRIMQQGAELILSREADMQDTDSVRFGDVSRLSASLMCVPMRQDGQPIGVLSIQSYTTDAYTHEDLRTLQALADYCGGAMQRIQAEQALQQREELNRTILATAMDGFFTLDFATDPGGVILEVNDAYCRLTGYSREELLQLRIADLEAAESCEEVARHKARIMAAGADRFETRHRRKDGREVQVEISVSRLAGSGERVFGFVRDITERKRSELMKEALLSLGAKLSTASSPVEAARAIYASADLLWKWDCGVLDLQLPESGQIETALAYDMVDGQRREVALPEPMGLASPTIRRIMVQGPELILRKPDEPQATDTVRFGDTSRLSASLMCVPMRREGQPVGVLSVQSYTPDAFTKEDLRTLQALADHCGGALERIQAEAALREAHDKLERRVQERTGDLRAANEALSESEQKYRRLHESMRDAFVSVDISGRIIEFNPAYQALFDYTANELRNLTYVELTPEKWHALEARIVAEQILPRGYSDVYEKEYRRKDGTIFPVELRTFLIRDTHDQPAAMWTIVRDITRRKLSEKALREARDTLEARVQERTAELQAANAALGESEERYRSLVNNLNVGVYRNTPGPHGRFIHANPALARMHGYDSVEEFQRVSVSDLYQEAAERKKFVAEVLHKGSVVNYEIRAKKKDGTAIYGSVNATAHRGPDGEVDWIDGVLEDITQRKQAEEALRVSEERYRALAESSPDSIFILDRDVKLQYVNSTTAAFWRRSPQELIGLSQSELFPPDVARYHCKVVAEVFKTGKPVRRDEPLAFPTGEQWIDIRLAPLFGEHGTVTSVMGVCRDITERRRAEEALRQSEARLRAIISGAPVLLFAVDREGVIRFEDGQALKALGAAPGANLGRSVMEVYAHVPAILENARRALQGEEFEAIVGVGPTTFNCWYSPTRDKDGNLAGYIGVATDITEHHRLERQILEISDREQARIGQDIHDGLCQQLVSLAFDANALQRELTAENRPEAKTALRIAEFLDQAITESRQLSRGLFPVRLGKVGLSPALQELASTISARFQIQCRFNSKGPVAVKNAAIATHLYRIAQEAVANAVKHSRARTVCIRLRARTGQIELRVEDDGAGLSPAKRKKATGLGLHIMDYRARAVGGTLHVGPGRRGGTIVSCCVPRPKG